VIRSGLPPRSGAAARVSFVAFEQDLDGQVAAQVGVAPLEHRAHLPTGDFAKELVAATALCWPRHHVRQGRANVRADFVGGRFGQEDMRDRTDRLCQALQNMARLDRLEAEGAVLLRRAFRLRLGSRREPGSLHAGRANAFRGIECKQMTATCAVADLCHRGAPVIDNPCTLPPTLLQKYAPAVAPNLDLVGFQVESSSQDEQTQVGPRPSQRRHFNPPFDGAIPVRRAARPHAWPGYSLVDPSRSGKIDTGVETAAGSAGRV
jgi:hypothetical protein